MEKTKTLGDAYMVAAGVPVARPDHAYAITDLALRFRDHVAAHRFDGRAIDLRIGINSRLVWSAPTSSRMTFGAM
ncbi:MAG TPA: adenylate/guanylate cyclase domain-containing protein [Acidimicrobiia bacterium]|nr:adenylate/guanylate cyclase domain-containing protein [Acidimicrobiia bacterium]